MRDLQEKIAELGRRGSVTEAEVMRMEGPIPNVALIKAVLLEMSGEENWDAHRFYCSALERCGSHPEEGHSVAQVQAYEQVRKLLIQSGGDRSAFESFLTERAV